MEGFYKGQCEVLERVAAGAPLGDSLAAIVRLIEAQGTMSCSILLLDPDGTHVRHGAAPTLPADYVTFLDGMAIGPTAGSCGAAAFLRRQIIVEDIATHPNWAPYRDLALAHGLRACWSSPILDHEDRVLGTFAMYYREPRGPTPAEMELVATATHLAAVAISHARNQAALRASEERLRAVVENTPNVAIQWYDDEGRILFCNDASKRMFGWRDTDVLGKKLVELGFFGDAEEAKFAAARRLALTGAEVAPHEFEFHRPDGSLGYLMSTVFQIPYGDGTCYVCMDVDLTERRRMEQAVRAGEVLRATIYASVVDPIFCIGVEGDDRYRFLSINPACAREIGRPEAEVVGRELGEVVPEPTCARVRAKYREAIEKRAEVSWESFGMNPRNFGHGVVTVRPLFDEAGRCTLVGTMHDITDIRKAEAERRALEAQLQQNQRLQSLGTLASGIAHDFNNILTAISGNAALALEDGTTPADIRDCVVDIQQATRRATALVRQILAFGRKHETRMERLDVRVVLDEVLGLLRASIPSRIRIVSRVADEPLVTLVDPTQLHQVVMNLVTNASQAIGDTGTIEVAAQPYVHAGGALELADGRYIRVSVRDSGHGMDDATLARAFDPFFTTKPAGEGAGLGLSIVHSIVRGHGGAIAVRSKLGEGTTFDLYFPVSDEAQPAATGPHVLLVDDEQAILFLGARILTKLGYRVTTRADAQQALDDVRAAPATFDAVISDVALPTMSGVSLLAEVRRVRPNLPVQLTSGFVRREDIAAARAANLAEPVPKPNTPEEFAWLVARLLSGVRAASA